MADGARPARILFIDDFPETIDRAAAGLSQLGFEIQLALDGEQGVQRALTEHPDLIVLDLAMPRLDGLGACRILKSHPSTRSIPVVLYSAHAGKELAALAESVGADGCVPKMGGDLVGEVRRLLA